MFSDFLRRSEILLKPPPLDPRMFYQRSMNRYVLCMQPLIFEDDKAYTCVKFDDPSNYSAKYHAYAISRPDYSKCHYIRYVWLHLPVFVYTGLINKSLLTSEASSEERNLRALAKVCVAGTSIIGNAGQSLCWTCMHGLARLGYPIAQLNLFIAFTELIR